MRKRTQNTGVVEEIVTLSLLMHIGLILVALEPLVKVDKGLAHKAGSWKQWSRIKYLKADTYVVIKITKKIQESVQFRKRPEALLSIRA
jgi:hypothetical protein